MIAQVPGVPEAVNAAEARLIFAPPRSAGLNPIEAVFLADDATRNLVALQSLVATVPHFDF